MTDDIWKRDEVESPCVNVCVVHPVARICTGCFRTIEEIGGWSRLSPAARRAVMIDLPDRKNLLTKRRGGRKARLAQE
ncbi:DUF1289 domain-containing protein [Aliiroseovarius sp. S1339]|uniref:DUF1289 domain-containing protein n=1 Tax=Aliiroseovarius sp. S1339 TaxID=2936990 RepID=UPI0020C0F64C|nr:DUF1289 domain-containing protein [Aliiroseovarius sp. S1339]MCK8462635.1 DUF1289 domain-containing protein [Aliiroseovarius sp. S1339]